MAEKLNITDSWDKTFERNEYVSHKKVTFKNRFGITLVADLYEPKNSPGSLPAIAVSGPFGAIKEQCSGLYAQTMAEKGFITLAFDPSFTGESGGTVRNVASPDINTEDFSAAVDFLSVQDNVDADRIGVIGICGWGGLALNAASIDTRIKATVASTMYDMSRVSSNGYFDSMTEDDRYGMKQALNTQRIEDFKNGEYDLAGGVPGEVAEEAPFFLKDYHDYYKTDRGYHERSLNSNGGWNKTSSLSFVNTAMLDKIGEIRNAVMIAHGEKAHSFYFGKDAFDKLKGDNKEFVAIPDAVHIDLYDRVDVIPFDRFEEFFRDNLK